MDFLWQEVTGGKDVVIDLVKVLLAFVIAIPVGWERHVSDRNLGLRTFPIVAIGACGFILLTEEFANGDPDAIARALNGVITGVGFIGGGAILKGHGSVRGLSTAASIWCMGAIGAAVALERLVVAVTIMLITFTIMRSLAPLVESGKVRSDAEGEE